MGWNGYLAQNMCLKIFSSSHFAIGAGQRSHFHCCSLTISASTNRICIMLTGISLVLGRYVTHKIQVMQAQLRSIPSASFPIAKNFLWYERESF